MLKKHKKITKKELKKDPLVLLSAHLIDYLKVEWVKILATIATVVIVVVLALVIVKGKKRGELNAYDAAITALQKNAPEANDLLTKLSDKYGGSDSAAEALVLLGNRYFQQKDYANSEKCFSRYVKKYAKDPVLSFNAFNNLGSVYEEKNDFKAAAQTYEDYAKRFKDAVFAPRMLLNAGKAYLLAGDKDAARKNLTMLTEQFRDSREKQEAMFYLETLK